MKNSRQLKVKLYLEEMDNEWECQCCGARGNTQYWCWCCDRPRIYSEPDYAKNKMDISDRMKSYEKVVNHKLVPRLPIIVRVDGRAFHTFCKNMQRPYDERMSKCMIETTKYLVKETNAVIGYQQSDEINLILFSENPQSEPFFDGRIQKLSSVIASLASVEFLTQYTSKFIHSYIPSASLLKLPTFDCRVYNVPTKTEAVNTLIWREMDAVRNSITMAAQSVYSHKELYGKKTDEMQEMLFQKGINWNDYPVFFKRGTYVRRIGYTIPVPLDQIPDLIGSERSVVRHKIETIDCPRLLSLENRVDFIFDNARPLLKQENEDIINAN